MAKNRIITGLDIGTSEIKALAAVKNLETNTLEVLGRARCSSFGVRRGIVAKPEEVSKKISEVLLQLQQEIGQKIEDVFTNVGGRHIFTMSSHGSIVVSRADQRISEEDKSRVMQTAQTFPLPSNNEILDIFPREFIVDNQGQIKEPLNMRGLRLEVKIIALCAFSPFMKNITAAVLEGGFQVSDVTPSILASSRAVLTPQQKESGVCILDIGAGTGGTTKFLKTYGEVMGLEANPLARSLAQKRGLRVVAGTAEKLPFEKEKFDIVTVFDVLYHQNIGSDIKVLQEAHRVLKPKGYLVITDCALPFLKSPHDEVMQARERYTKKELMEKIEKAGFRVEKASYVFFLVFPLTLLKRLLDRLTKSHSSNVSPVPKILNHLLLTICHVEAWCLKVINFPWGSSIVIRAKKQEQL